MTKEDVDALVAQVRAGNPDGFEGIVRNFERPIRAWLATQSPPGVDVDEIAQRSFLAAYTRLDDYQVGTDFAAWLFTIARFQLRTETTRLRRIADYHNRYAPDLLRRELERRETEMPELQQAKLDHLKGCLDGLGENLREYVAWRYDEAIPLEEMANRTGRTVAAIKKQLWQIRRKLQHCIQARLASEGDF